MKKERDKSRFFGTSSYILNVPNKTKQDLIQEVACSTGIIRSEIKIVVEQLLGLVGESLADRRSIEIRGFGTFICKERKARPARNPRTGEEVLLQKRTIPAFKFSSEVKAAIATTAIEKQTSKENSIHLVK
ncbi:MAG: integration host factor subunit beta [Fibrobacteraceae bacterium]|nr:integration host factor subunit beta [Fibrobacteraceae bacterium]